MRQQNTKSAPRRGGAPKRSGMAKRSGAPKREGAPRGGRKFGAPKGERRFGAKGKRIAEEERGVRRRTASAPAERPIKRRKSEIEEMRSKVEEREPVKGFRHLPLQAYTASRTHSHSS